MVSSQFPDRYSSDEDIGSDQGPVSRTPLRQPGDGARTSEMDEVMLSEDPEDEDEEPVVARSLDTMGNPDSMNFSSNWELGGNIKLFQQEDIDSGVQIDQPRN